MQTAISTTCHLHDQGYGIPNATGVPFLEIEILPLQGIGRLTLQLVKFESSSSVLAETC